MTQFSHVFHPSIIREYDIRGIVDKNLNTDDLYAIGRAFGTMVVRAGGLKVGLCYDGRHSSPGFADAMTKGLLDCGLHIEDYGIAPTPLVNYALKERNLDGAIAITGSHNPPEYNGIKTALRSGPVYGAAIQEIARIAASGDVVSAKGGQVTKITIYEEYINRLVSAYQSYGKPDLKVAWDAGNGAGAAVLKKFTDKIPGTHILLFDDVDGNFPNHHPDPSVEKNLLDLKKAVIDNQCDLGIAFDGDADRIGAVDSNGNMIWSDQLVALYAREILDRLPGSDIIIDVKCSNTVADLINGWGGNTIIHNTGHSLMKAKMMETGAPMGGELSGHIFFKDGFYGNDDALYCAIRLLNVVQKYGPLSEQKKLFPPVYNTPEIRFDVPEEDKFALIEKAKEYLKSNASSDISILDIDGIRVTTPIGWWLLRASNTQNALTARIEANSPEDLAQLEDMFKNILNSIGCEYPNPLY
jgi:phosphomannomutase